MHITCIQKDFLRNLKKKIDEYNDLYVQSGTLLLTDVFENFWNVP